MANVINLGSGNFVINHGTHKGAWAIFIEPAPAPGIVGDDASGSGLKSDELAAGSTIITFANKESVAAFTAEIEEATRHL